jgi:hypothetical protein
MAMMKETNAQRIERIRLQSIHGIAFVNNEDVRWMITELTRIAKYKMLAWYAE